MKRLIIGAAVCLLAQAAAFSPETEAKAQAVARVVDSCEAVRPAAFNDCPSPCVFRSVHPTTRETGSFCVASVRPVPLRPEALCRGSSAAACVRPLPPPKRGGGPCQAGHCGGQRPIDAVTTPGPESDMRSRSRPGG